MWQNNSKYPPPHSHTLQAPKSYALARVYRNMIKVTTLILLNSETIFISFLVNIDWYECKNIIGPMHEILVLIASARSKQRLWQVRTILFANRTYEHG